jgi:hypothetical protein
MDTFCLSNMVIFGMLFNVVCKVGPVVSLLKMKCTLTTKNSAYPHLWRINVEENVEEVISWYRRLIKVAFYICLFHSYIIISCYRNKKLYFYFTQGCQCIRLLRVICELDKS